MNATSFDMERSIARCRVFLSLIAILTLYADPTEPTLTRWLPLTGGAFTVNRYWATVLVAHLAYSLTLVFLQTRPSAPSLRLATIATWGTSCSPRRSRSSPRARRALSIRSSPLPCSLQGSDPACAPRW